MSFLPNDRPHTWFDEFLNEVVSDHRQLLACRESRRGHNGWSFEHAVKRTQSFYDERFNGYHKVGSITRAQLDRLLVLVEALGRDDFPEL